MDNKTLEVVKGLPDNALKVVSLLLRQKRAGGILSEARKHLNWEEFQELEKYTFEKLEK